MEARTLRNLVFDTLTGDPEYRDAEIALEVDATTQAPAISLRFETGEVHMLLFFKRDA